MGRRLYSQHFGMEDNAFSITPDPRYLYMSERHCEAIAHLLYGVVETGCFVTLTGEVGTGKTTICRAVLEQLPENIEVALLLDPPNSEHQLLLALIDELHISIARRNCTCRELVNILYDYLLQQHSDGKRTVVIIDEAQNILPEVLERVRLLTNLETHTEKLLHVILIGQTELRQQLEKHSLRQVAQRITARYHLTPLTHSETKSYITHRLSVSGARFGLFSDSAMRQVYLESSGIPRIINILCDRALLTAYASDLGRVGRGQVKEAAKAWRDQLEIPDRKSSLLGPFKWLTTLVTAIVITVGLSLFFMADGHVITDMFAVVNNHDSGVRSPLHEFYTYINTRFIDGRE